MTKLKVFFRESGAANFSGNLTICKSGDPDDIAAMQRVIALGDTQDMDDGATDGDIDYKRRDRILGFINQTTEVTVKLVEE